MRLEAREQWIWLVVHSVESVVSGVIQSNVTAENWERACFLLQFESSEHIKIIDSVSDK